MMFRPATLWRSSAMLRPVVDPGRELAAIGIRTVIDLREEGERAAAPDGEDGAVTWHWVPVFDNRLISLEWEDLSELYGHMLDQFGHQLARAVSLVAGALPEPVLVHCTAGKDRTGMVCALIQETVGVDRDDILDDYARSADLLGEDYLRDLGALQGEGPLEGMRAHRSVASPRHLMAHSLEELDRRGGAVRYLLDHGVTPEQVSRLREVLAVAR